jgi:hypothetical protein
MGHRILPEKRFSGKALLRFLTLKQRARDLAEAAGDLVRFAFSNGFVKIF